MILKKSTIPLSNKCRDQKLKYLSYLSKKQWEKIRTRNCIIVDKLEILNVLVFFFFFSFSTSIIITVSRNYQNIDTFTNVNFMGIRWLKNHKSKIPNSPKRALKCLCIMWTRIKRKLRSLPRKYVTDVGYVPTIVERNGKMSQAI